MHVLVACPAVISLTTAVHHWKVNPYEWSQCRWGKNNTNKKIKLENIYNNCYCVTFIVFLFLLYGYFHISRRNIWDRLSQATFIARGTGLWSLGLGRFCQNKSKYFPLRHGCVASGLESWNTGKTPRISFNYSGVLQFYFLDLTIWVYRINLLMQVKWKAMDIRNKQHREVVEPLPPGMFKTHLSCATYCWKTSLAEG